MPKRVPSYRRHKPFGLAVVTIDGRGVYLGPCGSIESHEKYGRLLAQNASDVAVDTQIARDDRTVNEVVLAFLRHAKQYYVKDGRQTAEYSSFLSAARPLVKLCPWSFSTFSKKSIQASSHEIRISPMTGFVGSCYYRVNATAFQQRGDRSMKLQEYLDAQRKIDRCQKAVFRLVKAKASRAVTAIAISELRNAESCLDAILSSAMPVEREAVSIARSRM